MRNSIDHYDVANEISMRRSVETGAFVVVEGVTDYRLYGKFSNPEDCRMVIAHSKDNVLMSVEELAGRRGDERVGGIVDADYDRLSGVYRGPAVFSTDTHDLETMIIRSEALESILWEYADQTRLQEFEKRSRKNVRQALLDACYPLGVLMHLSLREGYELSFRDLDHCNFIRHEDLSVDHRGLLNCVYANSRYARVPKKEVSRALRDEMGRDWDPWQVCRGHDMVDVLLLGLKNVFGSYNSRHLNHGALSGALRLAYDRAVFHDTELRSEMEEWGEERGVKVWLPCVSRNSRG